MCRNLAALLPLLVGTTLAAQNGLRILQVPERVQLPAPGANLLLEVEATAAPTTIWLAVDAAAQDRVPLVAAGNGRYQLNLGAPAVADLLPSGRDRGDLFVFAQIGTERVRSAAIAWSRATPTAAGKLRCIVRSEGIVARRVAPDSTTWLDLAKVQRLEIEGAAERQASAVARLADLDLPLVRKTVAGAWTLEPTPSVRERLAASNDFEIELRRGATTESFRFRCVPTQLDLPNGPEQFVVPQRKRALLPGSRGWLEVRLDDITAGHVQFELVTAEGTPVVPAKFVHERDHVEFALGDRRYVVVVAKLVNILIGEDHAEFVVQPAAGFQPARIGLLLAAMRESKDVFLREGKEYSGAEAATFLVMKLTAQHGEKPTVDEFVDRLASQSSRSGDPYHVRRAGGEVVTMRDWLRAELQRLDGAAQQPR